MSDIGTKPAKSTMQRYKERLASMISVFQGGEKTLPNKTVPYKTTEQLPDVIKSSLPAEAQKIWMGAYNTAHEAGDNEGEAAGKAWAAVKRKFKKEGEDKDGKGGKWVKMDEPEPAWSVTFVEKLTNPVTLTFKEELSFDDIRNQIDAAINKNRGHEFGLPHLWVNETFASHAIIQDYKQKKYYKLGYKVKDGDIELGTIEEVKKKTVYEPVKDALASIAANEKFRGVVALSEAGVDANTIASLGQDEKITTDIEILRTGSWDHPEYGKIKVTESDLDQFIANFNSNVRGVDLAVDQAHKPDEGAAGWFRKLFKQDGQKKDAKGKTGASLFATVEWTKLGVDLVKNQIFKYFSPEFTFKYKDDETGKVTKNVLYGGALTNRPFIKGMAPVLLSEDVAADITAAEIAIMSSRFFLEDIDEGGGEFNNPAFNEPGTESHVFNEPFSEGGNNDTTNPGANKAQNNPKGGNVTMQLSEIRKALGLAENAEPTAEQKTILDAFAALQAAEGTTIALAEVSKILNLGDKAGQKEALQAIEALVQKTASFTGKESDIVALKEENTKLTKRLEATEQKLLLADWKELSTKAMSEGRMTAKQEPKLRERYMKDPEGTKELIDMLEPVIDFKEHGSARDTQGSNIKIFNEKVAQKMKDKPALTYSDAANEVAQEEPTLWAEVDRERRGN